MNIRKAHEVLNKIPKTFTGLLMSKIIGLTNTPAKEYHYISSGCRSVVEFEGSDYEIIIRPI